ncbi:MAG TPA: glycosyltransferase [Desulfatiglandales bacterium]|nr:glycosyltransferase [Desulfatiglandales bacterium]
MTANKRINILFIHANNYDIGGSDYCLLKLAATLDRTRFNPIVLLGLETEVADKYRAHGIPLKIIPMYRVRKIKAPGYQFKFVFLFFPTVLKIASLIKKYQIDIVHSNDFLDIYGPIAARLIGVKSIQHDRLIMRRPVWLKQLLCAFIRKINHRIAVVSDGVARAMFSKNHKVHAKVVTCYDWLDMEMVGHGEGSNEFRNEIGVGEEHVLIGAVGRLEPWKGQHVFVKAAAEVANSYPDARFVIVGGKVIGRGREKYGDELRTIASELQIENKLSFVGHRKDISNVMSALDIYVHCSVEPDPLPGVVMEAMAMAKPVIGPRAGGVPEEVEEGVTGFLYEPGDNEDMAIAICKLIASPQLAENFGIAGKKRAYTVFGKGALCRHMENVYEDMLND